MSLESDFVTNNIRGYFISSIRDICRDDWNACFPDELESYDYLLAVEESDIAGFTFSYAVIGQGKKILACMPAFFAHYNLATTLENGIIRNFIERIQRSFPKFLKLNLTCLGSPATECGKAGFHTDVQNDHKPVLLASLIRCLEEEAERKKIGLIGIKDIPESQKELWDAVCRPVGYSAISSLSTASMAIDFNSVDEYLRKLGSNTRKNMRRKLKSLAKVRVEYHAEIDDLLPGIHSLYMDTKNRSELQFEEMTEAYFSNVLKYMKNKSVFALYYVNGKLLAANLLLKDGNKLLDKFFCMDGKQGREYNLYFISWFNNIQYCLDNGIHNYQSGQAGNNNKLRLGSRLSANWLMFKHTNYIINFLLKLIAPLFAIKN